MGVEPVGDVGVDPDQGDEVRVKKLRPCPPSSPPGIKISEVVMYRVWKRGTVRGEFDTIEEARAFARELEETG